MTDDLTPNEPQDDAEKTARESEAAPPQSEHTLKQELRGAIGKVVGIAVETGSMLSGNAGDIVSAEGAVAEADTEKLIDRIDGEG